MQQRASTEEVGVLRAHHRWHGIIALVLVELLILISLAWGVGPQAGCACDAETVIIAPPLTPAETAPSTAEAPSAGAPQSTETALIAVAPAASESASATPASVPLETDALPGAMLFFAVGASKLNLKDVSSLDAVVAYLKEHPGAKAVVMGFHDSFGGAALNETLAYQRAVSVGEALLAAGVARERIIFEKPPTTTGTGTPQEARRAEVSIRP